MKIKQDIVSIATINYIEIKTGAYKFRLFIRRKTMIEIKKVDSIERLNFLKEKSNIKEKYVLAFEAIDKNESLGYCIYKQNYDNIGRILALCLEDKALTDTLGYGICKAVLNSMDLDGIKKVYWEENNQELCKRLLFKKENEKYLLNLEGYFSSGC